MPIIHYMVNNILCPKGTCSTLASKCCIPCSCDKQGSVSHKCDATGKCTCKPKYEGKQCGDKNCTVSKWSAWSTCPCGRKGTITRSRTVIANATGKGDKCPDLNENKKCTGTRCDCSKIRPGYYGVVCENRDCKLGGWSAWGKCSQKCPGSCYLQNCKDPAPGSRVRQRGEQISRQGNGNHCTGNRTETGVCSHCERECSFEHISSDMALPIIPCHYKIKLKG